MSFKHSETAEHHYPSAGVPGNGLGWGWNIISHVQLFLFTSAAV